MVKFKILIKDIFDLKMLFFEDEKKLFELGKF